MHQNVSLNILSKDSWGKDKVPHFLLPAAANAIFSLIFP